ncbi:cytochrome c oxidase subunit II [Botrimarina mediterranea]|uniref:cytochrome c oxidase subunit II n=1 Tax=Botrimarina mediterranea TaxID=2528022 RepID=UPI001E51CF66|nr:cytochrome c oxidase subunit II [Botrimarina mediterranea]
MVLPAVVVCGGCQGPQSALSPAGEGAEQIAALFWAMAIGAGMIWLIVIGLAVYVLRIAPYPHDTRSSRQWVIGGGVVVPTLLLTILLMFGLAILPALVRPAPGGSLHVEAVGVRWWWRIIYPTPDGGSFELANEVRLPAGEPVQFDLRSADVIHGFWIPSLGGKVDMIPGRQTRLTLWPTTVGTYRGVCAEYCGASHAKMAFDVVVMPRAEFDTWLRQQAQDAVDPSGSEARRGSEVFLKSGCGACHSVRGTPADGSIAPDLTHLGSRRSLAAGSLENSPDNLRRWITDPQSIKPMAVMPGFHTLSDADLASLIAYLQGLE